MFLSSVKKGYILPFIAEAIIRAWEWVRNLRLTVTATLIISAIVGLFLVGSWEARYRFLTHKSLFAFLSHAVNPDQTP